MKTTIFFLGILFSLFFQNISTNEYDLFVSTKNNKKALITVEKSEFEKNVFSITLDINWVDEGLLTITDLNSVIGINKELIKIYPEEAVSPLIEEDILYEFSNNQVVIKFYANPDFEGGDIKLDIPLVYAENKEKATNGDWEELLFSQPKKLSIDYFIDADKIIDIYPPEITVIAPINLENPDETIYTVQRKIDIIVKVEDKGEIKSVKINEVNANYQSRAVKPLGSKETEEVDGYKVSVTLLTGENIIKIEATDVSGNTTVKKIGVVCTFQYDLDIRQGKYYALLIAENDYTDPSINDLTFPIQDAEKLKKILISDYIFNKENIITMKNPTREEIITEFENLSNTLTENDNLLIFYAGHGYWDETKKVGYWFPSDAKMNSVTNWVRNSTIKDYIGAINTKHTLLITDACFSGSIFQTRSVEEFKVVAYNKLYDIKSRKGMTSGTLKEVPDESVFLATLILRLEQNDEKYLPVSNLFNSMRDVILNNSPNVPQFGTIQGVDDQGGEFIFIRR